MFFRRAALRVTTMRANFGYSENLSATPHTLPFSGMTKGFGLLPIAHKVDTATLRAPTSSDSPSVFKSFWDKLDNVRSAIPNPRVPLMMSVIAIGIASW